MLRHERQCTMSPPGDPTVPVTDVVQGMLETIEILEARLAALEKTPSIQTVNNTVNNITNNFINNFGAENTDYITDELIHERFMCCIQGIIDMINDIYFHPDHPENKNVRIKSIKNGGFAEIRKGGEWITDSLEEVASKMVNTSYNILTRKYRGDLAYQAYIQEMHPYVEEWRLSQLKYARLTKDRAKGVLIDQRKKDEDSKKNVVLSSP